MRPVRVAPMREIVMRSGEERFISLGEMEESRIRP